MALYSIVQWRFIHHRGVVVGEWLGPGEGLPLFDVLADVESGAGVGVGP